MWFENPRGGQKAQSTNRCAQYYISEKTVLIFFFRIFETFRPVYGVGFTLVTAAHNHVCICPAATGLKPYYLNSQSCVIYGKHEAKAKKVQSWDISMEKSTGPQPLVCVQF